MVHVSPAQHRYTFHISHSNQIYEERSVFKTK
jgi:hypothetical protein